MWKRTLFIAQLDADGKRLAEPVAVDLHSDVATFEFTVIDGVFERTEPIDLANWASDRVL